MRPRHIEVFTAVMRTGSLNAASRHLNVSQSALSQVLRHAETQLGYPLFNRQGGRLVATSEARLLFEEAQRAADALDDVRALAENLGRSRQDHLRIACSPAFTMGVMPRALGRLRRRFPKVIYTLKALHRREILRELATRAIDIGFMFNPPEQAGVETHEIGRTRFVAAVRQTDRKALPRAPLKLADALERLSVALPSDMPPGSLLAGMGYKKFLERDDLVHVQTSVLALSVVAHEGGLALVDQLTATSFRPPQIDVLAVTPEVSIGIWALQVEGSERSLVSNSLVQLMSDECMSLFQGK